MPETTSPRYRFRYRFVPKPLFLTRPSGLYVRFLVPADLRAAIGSRFVVRSLDGMRGDRARFLAAAYGVALSQAFDTLRQGDAMVDVKKLLDSARQAADRGDTRDWTASGVKIGRVNLGTVSINGREDTEDFVRAVQALLDTPSNAALRSPHPGIRSLRSARAPGAAIRRVGRCRLADQVRACGSSGFSWLATTPLIGQLEEPSTAKITAKGRQVVALGVGFGVVNCGRFRP